MDALITKANAKVNIHLADENHSILANKNALTGAIQNLVHNALQATSAEKNQQAIINIQIYTHHGDVYISVKDNGPGIRPEDINRLTERFFRVDKSRSRDTGGSGLGLAIVKHVLNHHNAELL